MRINFIFQFWFWTSKLLKSFHPNVQGVSFSTASSMDVKGVSTEYTERQQSLSGIYSIMMEKLSGWWVCCEYWYQTIQMILLNKSYGRRCFCPQFSGFGQFLGLNQANCTIEFLGGAWLHVHIFIGMLNFQFFSLQAFSSYRPSQ